VNRNTATERATESGAFFAGREARGQGVGKGKNINLYICPEGKGGDGWFWALVGTYLYQEVLGKLSNKKR